MDIKELFDYIDEEDLRIRKRFGNYSDEDKRIMARTIKLGEEYGELCDKILGYLSFQRQDKSDNYDNSKLEDEFADVLITTMLVAKSMNVDIEKALKEKIKENQERE